MPSLDHCSKSSGQIVAIKEIKQDANEVRIGERKECAKVRLVSHFWIQGACLLLHWNHQLDPVYRCPPRFCLSLPSCPRHPSTSVLQSSTPGRLSPETKGLLRATGRALNPC